jgi:hypothetical protein
MQNAIDASLANWKQGDCVLGEHWFVYRFSADRPLTEAARTAAGEGVDLAEDAVAGFAILTQTCDIVRPSVSRPYLEVAPLVEVSERDLREIERGYRPRYAFVPGLADRGLVVDLDRVMTVEKAVVACWERVPGCLSDEAMRRLAHALARKRSRFAFPDDFAMVVGRLQERLLEKHDRRTAEGQALRSLQEIRVQATPSWDAVSVDLLFIFIRRHGADDFDGTSWDELLQKWLELVEPAGRFQTIDGIVVTMDDLTGRDYVESDPLDLDFVTVRSE